VIFHGKTEELTSKSHGLQLLTDGTSRVRLTLYFQGYFVEKDLIEVRVKGIVIDSKANNPVVVLVDLEDKKVLPIWIGVFEAEAISRGLENVVTLRPMTHDLLTQVLDTFHVAVSRIVINDLKGNTYYANLYLNMEGKEIVIDSRPSDAIALAVRVKAPIFVSPSVVKSTEELGLLAPNLLGDEDELATIMEKMKPEDFGKYKM
jgi:uncharacterized protein